ncbi:MAG TPA: hypothetical protein VG253_19475 [Streptosporangiaceae bacterium]|jgi:hypothetical protein|nr:hypothetical protein [Streptosporangiaceae bacterium]
MTLAHQFSYDTYEDAVADYFDLGFTDGMPIVPPTPESVGEMLARAGLPAGEVLGEVPTRNVNVTAEKAAVNAVMAGCLPDYFPVVVAAVRAHLLPKGNSHSTTATLGGAAHAVIVNGPAVRELGIHSGQACFGPGFRANATIGRALRLVIRNVCNSVPGVLDRATFSWPLRYSFCFGENEEASEWTPLHVQRGFDVTDSVVTVHSVMDFVQAIDFDPGPEAILTTIAVTGRQRGLARDEWCGDDRGLVVVIGSEHRQRFTHDGWSKERIQEYLWPRLTAETTSKYDMRVSLAAPENILVVAAGGPGIPVSWLLLPHLSNPMSERVQ